MVCGIDIDNEIKIAFVKKRGKKFHIKCKNFPKVSKGVKRLYKKTTCTGLGPDEFILNELEITWKNFNSTDKALFYQIKPLSHLPNRIDFPYLHKRENEKAYFSIFTTTEDSLASHLENLKSFSIDPDIVSTTPSALASFASSQTDVESAYLLNISKETSTLVWMEDKRVKKAFQIDLGSTQLTDKKAFDLFINKLNTFFLSFPKDKLPLVVSGSFDKSFIPLIEKKFSQWILGALIPNNYEYAVAIGLGIQAYEKNTIQFRQNKWIAKKFVRRFIFKFLFLLTFSISASAYLYQEKSKTLAKEDQRIESLFDTAYLIDQEQFSKKPDLNKTFNQKASDWKKELKKVSFPYMNAGPSAKELFSFLENQPLVSKINIQKIEFRLETFSKIGSLGAKPKLFVEITYSGDKTDARKFYETIADDKSFIASSEKITWTPLQDTYNLTFYCKPTP